jgi:serine/threonine protein phosphatase 1
VNIIKELFLDSKQRLFITGDLHGSLDLLESSLKELGFISGQDVLICVGDLVDRHPKSEETLIKFLFDKTGSFYSVRGNHDQMMVDNDWDLQLYNGGQWILDVDYEARVGYGIITDHKLPFAIEVNYNGKVYGVCHAEVPLEFESWDDYCDTLQHNKQLQKETLWNREIIAFPEHCKYGFCCKQSNLYRN